MKVGKMKVDFAEVAKIAEDDFAFFEELKTLIISEINIANNTIIQSIKNNDLDLFKFQIHKIKPKMYMLKQHEILSKIDTFEKYLTFMGKADWEMMTDIKNEIQQLTILIKE